VGLNRPKSVACHAAFARISGPAFFFVVQQIMYYVYSHTDPLNKETFYIGKGTGNRAYRCDERGSTWTERVAAIHKSGLTFEVRVLHICSDEEEAFDLERIEIGLRLRSGQKLVNEVHKKYRCEDQLEMDPQTIGDFVRLRRRAAGLSQQDFANKSGVGIRFLRELEQQKKITLRMDKVNEVLAMFGAELGIAKKKRPE
jgi:y4mF family transcriptional regulator